MNNPQDFDITSDFATLKNDNSGDISVTFPGSFSVPGNGLSQFTNTINIGTRGAALRTRASSSKDSNTWYVCSSLSYMRTGMSGGFSASYSVVAAASRTSPTTITVVALVLNPYSGTLVTEAGNETFSFHLNTFLPPF